jgi:phosphorylcholine metabolism protein LicD
MDGDKKVDIFVKFYKGSKAYTLSSLPDGTFNAGVYPKRHFEPLDRLHHEGMDWNIPNDVENYLSAYYGDDWRVPRPIWDWTKDAPCINKGFKI